MTPAPLTRQYLHFLNTLNTEHRVGPGGYTVDSLRTEDGYN